MASTNFGFLDKDILENAPYSDLEAEAQSHKTASGGFKIVFSLVDQIAPNGPNTSQQSYMTYKEFVFFDANAPGQGSIGPLEFGPGVVPPTNPTGFIIDNSSGSKDITLKMSPYSTVFYNTSTPAPVFAITYPSDGGVNQTILHYSPVSVGSGMEKAVIGPAAFVIKAGVKGNIDFTFADNDACVFAKGPGGNVSRVEFEGGEL